MKRLLAVTLTAFVLFAATLLLGAAVNSPTNAVKANKTNNHTTIVQVSAAENATGKSMLSFLDPTPTVSATNRCSDWQTSCYGAAWDAFTACQRAYGSTPFCIGDYNRIYNACMEGTGCPYTPLND